MFKWSITFLIVAVAAALLGFSGLAGDAAWLAKIAFVVALLITVVSFAMGRRAA